MLPAQEFDSLDTLFGRHPEPVTQLDRLIAFILKLMPSYYLLNHGIILS